MRTVQTPHRIAPQIAHLAVPISALRHYERNPRQGDIGALTESLEYHGQFRPLVVNKRDNTVLAGNHTLAAMRALGWEQAAVTYVDVDDAQAARIVLADNRSADLASNDSAKLAQLLQDIGDLAGTLYDQDALDALLADLDVPLQPEGASTEYNPEDLWPRVTISCPPHVEAAWTARLKDQDVAPHVLLATLLGVAVSDEDI